MQLHLKESPLHQYIKYHHHHILHNIISNYNNLLKGISGSPQRFCFLYLLLSLCFCLYAFVSVDFCRIYSKISA